MNILFVAQRVPDPPNKGDKIRAHHIARRLAERHAVHVACLADAPTEATDVESVRGWAASVTWRVRRGPESAWRGATGALIGRPLSVGYFRSEGLARDIEALLAREAFDVAVAYCSSMAQYVEHCGAAKVLDLVDVDSEKWRQYAAASALPRKAVYALEHRLLRSYERRLVERFDRSIVISAAEREALAAFAPTTHVDVVPNGVDTEWWRPAGERTRDSVLVFVGALDYFANAEGIIHFARKTMPRIRELVPNVRLRIVGRRPGEDVRALGELPGVEVIGEVADVRPELWGAAVAVVPLRIAQGLQNKVLEAMAAGVPVVSSPAAVRGIAGEPGHHYLVGDSVAEFAAAVRELLAEPQRADRVAERGRELAVTGYSWDSAARSYEAALERAVGRRSHVGG